MQGPPLENQDLRVLPAFTLGAPRLFPSTQDPPGLWPGPLGNCALWIQPQDACRVDREGEPEPGQVEGGAPGSLAFGGFSVARALQGLPGDILFSQSGC